jgi:hypothetical protein
MSLINFQNEKDQIKSSIYNNLTNQSSLNFNDLEKIIQEKVEIELNKLNEKIFQIIIKNEELLIEEEILNKKLKLLYNFLVSYYENEKLNK